MEIRFKNEKLRQLCQEQAVAIKKLGDACARKLRTRLDDLAGASKVTDLVAGKPHPLGGNREGQFALELAGGWRLVFAPANDPVPRMAVHAARNDTNAKTAPVDWSKVTVVSIEYIGDYHD